MTNFTFYGGRKLSSEKSKWIEIVPNAISFFASVFVLRSQGPYYLLLSGREYVWLKRTGFLTDWLTEWLSQIWFCHDELINSIYDHKKTQRHADISSVSPSSKFSLRPRLQGSAQIFERTKTCTDPPFVYTGPAEPCTKLLNGKVCKFLTWSEKGQNFWQVPLFSQLAEVSFEEPGKRYLC